MIFLFGHKTVGVGPVNRDTDTFNIPNFRLWRQTVEMKITFFEKYDKSLFALM